MTSPPILQYFPGPLKMAPLKILFSYVPVILFVSRVGRDSINTRFFMNFAKYFLIPESGEVEVHTVSHFKAPVSRKREC